MAIDFIINDKKEFKENTLITGFHGIGTTGFIAIKYIIDHIQAERVGTIISSQLPPFITTKDGKMSLPFEIYQKEENTMLIPHFQPYRNEHRSFSEKIVDWTIKSQFKKAILIGGLDARLKKDEGDKIRVIATTTFLEKYKNESLPILEDGLFVTGPLALLLTFYEINDFPAIGLLPYAESSRVDPLAASQAIMKINQLTSLDINTTKLIQDAELIEQNLEEVITQTKDQQIDDKEQGSRRLYI
ncbi:MAG: proteasome assembly chaperone family protein [Candidatus Heimdallarchaeota archaeon]